jgi:hypothetical protein
MLFKEIIAIEACSEKYAKHINHLYGQNVVDLDLIFCGLCIVIYRICPRNFRPRVFCAPWFLKGDFGFIFAPRISRTIVLFIYQ